MANPTAVGLIRVSTKEQVLGLEAQRDAIRRFAVEHAIDVLAIHSEVVSGGAEFDNRIGLQAAIAEVAALHAAHLIVAKRDRFSREPMVSIMGERALGAAGATLLAADGNNALDPAAEAMRGMLDVFARYERKIIGLRTKAALRALRDSGKVLGRPPGAKDKTKRKVYKSRSDKGVKRTTATPVS
jgi:DNA invertase Pin-like site-specific DNA recombinase